MEHAKITGCEFASTAPPTRAFMELVSTFLIRRTGTSCSVREASITTRVIDRVLRRKLILDSARHPEVDVIVHPIGRRKVCDQRGRRRTAMFRSILTTRTTKEVRRFPTARCDGNETIAERPTGDRVRPMRSRSFVREIILLWRTNAHGQYISQQCLRQSSRARREGDRHRLRIRTGSARGTSQWAVPKTEQDAMAKVKARPQSDREFRVTVLQSRSGESPQHEVTVPEFLIARTEVTQQLWRSLARLGGLPESPSFFANAGKRAPVEQVSFDDVIRCGSTQSTKRMAWRCGCPAKPNGSTPAAPELRQPIYNGNMTIRGHCDCPEVDEIGWYMGNCGVDYAGGVNSSRWPERQYNHRRAGSHPVGMKKGKRVWPIRYDRKRDGMVRRSCARKLRGRSHRRQRVARRRLDCRKPGERAAQP